MINFLIRFFFIFSLAIGCSFAAHAETSSQALQDAIKDRRWVQAKTILLDVVREYPASPRAWYLLAVAEAQLGEYSTSRTYLDRAKLLNPGLDFANSQTTRNLELVLAIDAVQKKNGTHLVSPNPSASIQAIEKNNADYYFYSLLAFLLSVFAYGIFRLKFKKG